MLALTSLLAFAQMCPLALSTHAIGGGGGSGESGGTGLGARGDALPTNYSSSSFGGRNEPNMYSLQTGQGGQQFPSLGPTPTAVQQQPAPVQTFGGYPLEQAGGSSSSTAQPGRRGRRRADAPRGLVRPGSYLWWFCIFLSILA